MCYTRKSWWNDTGHSKTGETKLHFRNQASLIHNIAWKPWKSIDVRKKVIKVAFETTSISDSTCTTLTTTERSCPRRIQWVLTNVSTTRVNKASEYQHKKLKATSDIEWKLEAKLWSEGWRISKLDAVPLESVTLRFNKELSHRLEILIRANLMPKINLLSLFE